MGLKLTSHALWAKGSVHIMADASVLPLTCCGAEGLQIKN
jgi:hypothetical protein